MTCTASRPPVFIKTLLIHLRPASVRRLDSQITYLSINIALVALAFWQNRIKGWTFASWRTNFHLPLLLAECITQFQRVNSFSWCSVAVKAVCNLDLWCLHFNCGFYIRAGDLVNLSRYLKVTPIEFWMVNMIRINTRSSGWKSGALGEYSHLLMWLWLFYSGFASISFLNKVRKLSCKVHKLDI